MNVKALGFLMALVLSQSVFAIKMYYPGDTDGQTAVDQSTTPPQYYPAPQTNPLHPNQNIPLDYKKNHNVQGKKPMPGSSSTAK